MPQPENRVTLADVKDQYGLRVAHFSHSLCENDKKSIAFAKGKLEEIWEHAGASSTLAIDGHTWVFDTPIGKLHVVAKEENPEWVPPDWHFIEEARQNAMRVVYLNPGQSIDARTGDPVSRNEGIWSWFGGGSG